MDNSFKYFEEAEDNYLQDLTLQHNEHIEWCNKGFTKGMEFWNETVDDVYNRNTYSMSCFYN